MIKYLNKNDDFNELISSKDYLVDFYADWCGPCKMLGPVLETIENIDVIKINVDDNQEIAQKYGVMSIPTLICFKNGKEYSKEIGFRNKTEIEEMTK